MKFLFLLFLLLNCVLGLWTSQAQERRSYFQMSDTVDVSEFEGSRSKHWWCLLSDEQSKVSSKKISLQSSELSGSTQQLINRLGGDYSIKSIKWESGMKDDTFELHFQSTPTTFSADRRYDDTNCSFKLWSAKAVASSTTFRGEGHFVVPRNVWLIRVRFLNFFDSGGTMVNMAQYLPGSSNGGTETAGAPQEVPLNHYRGYGERYYLINATSRQLENIVKIKIEHINNTLKSSQVDLKIKIQFVTQTDCLNTIGQKTVGELLWQNLKRDPTLDNAFLERALINVACLGNENYIRHNLANMLFYQIPVFFRETRALEDWVTSRYQDLSPAQAVGNGDTRENLFHVFHQTVRQLRYYYGYEIARELYGAFTSMSESPRGGKLNALQILELLRYQGMHGLVTLATAGHAITYRAVQQHGENLRGPVSADDLDNLTNLLKFLKADIESKHQAFTTIYKMSFLGRNYFQLRGQSLNDLEQRRQAAEEGLKLWRQNNQNMGGITLKLAGDLNREFLNLNNTLSDYGIALSYLRCTENPLGNPEEIVKGYRDFEKSAIAIFYENVLVLQQVLDEYYLENFEHESLRQTPINGRVFATPGEFINEFKKFIGER
ncbi:MAG: hypothetical protein WCG27_09475 [Pseudomonadota bacterium]